MTDRTTDQSPAYALSPKRRLYTEVEHVRFLWWVARDIREDLRIDLSVTARTRLGARLKLWRFRREARR